MENRVMLSKQQMQTFAAELLTSEYSNRIDIRLNYLYNTYSEINGVEFLIDMVNTLQSYQNYIYSIIKYQPYPKFTNLIEEDKYFDNPPKRSERSKEEIDGARNERVGNRVYIYGELISGISGPDLSWNDIEFVKQKLIDFIDRKKSITETEVEKGKVTGLQNNSEYNFFHELFNTKDELNEYIIILKKVTDSEDKLLINEKGQIVKSRGFVAIIYSWLDALIEEGRITLPKSKLEIIDLMNKQFPELELKRDLSMWCKSTEIGRKFKPLFKVQIKKVK